MQRRSERGLFVAFLAMTAASFLNSALLYSAPPALAEPSDHWAYRPIDAQAPPTVRQRDRVRTPVDAFVIGRLEAAGLTLSPPADRVAWIRRVSIDLIGLPPTTGEVEEFSRDTSPWARQRVIDRLLASPRYGERWGRHWLDLARYAESDGFKSDKLRPGAWQYRDYVVQAFNADKPYDVFVREQIAGDEIPANELARHDGNALAATGFLRHWPYEDNGRTLDDMWNKVLADVTDVTGSVFLGLTVGCARCHDHKFDAISRRDYYGLQAFFAGMAPRDDLPVGSPKELSAYHEQLRRWQEATREIRTRRSELERPFRRQAELAKAKKFPPQIQQIAAIVPEKRTTLQRQILMLGGEELRVQTKDMMRRMDDSAKTRWEKLTEQLASFDALKPTFLPFARGVEELESETPPTRIPDDPGAGDITPGILTVLRQQIPEVPRASGRRTALARWVTDARNPLTARVIVNRIWQYHFGRGLVATSSDFGVQSEPPTHPQLLDWLARELVAGGWSLKRLHRLILLSSVYGQSSLPAEPGKSVERDARRVDPENRLFWRMPSRRLEAEALRDGVLAASGELNTRMFGDSVLPALPSGMSDRYAWKPTPNAAERNRRSVYLVVKRNLHLPLLKTFDVPDNHSPCSRRVETTIPTQALILLNSEWMLERAQSFAARLLREVGSDPGDLIARAYALVFSRAPAAEEAAASMDFLREAAAAHEGELKRNDELAARAESVISAVLDTPGRSGETTDALESAFVSALVDFCHALWNTNEFLYVD